MPTLPAELMTILWVPSPALFDADVKKSISPADELRVLRAIPAVGWLALSFTQLEPLK
jgi:hypothetical protein